jgi:GTP-binding protein Era
MSFKSGFIAITGNANVGKSTLLNKILKQKISIVSPKPQTTRNTITGILNDKDYQIVFLDTPGMHKIKNKLDSFMEKSITKALDGVDGVVFMLDAGKPFFDELLERIATFAKSMPVIVAVNKIDEVESVKFFPKLAKLNELKDVKDIVPISAKTGENVDELIKCILKILPEGEPMYPTDEVTESSERFLSSEIIREKALWLLNQEIPHGIAVLIEKFSDEENVIKIDATIICEKDNHKQIIIGKNGTMLKKIAEKSRIEMEKILGKKVFLTVWVKVDKKWRENDILTINFGYDKKNI